MKIKQLFTYLTFVFFTVSLQCTSLFAQSTSSNAKEGMANLMYQSGKIYVVVGVILLIFIGVVFYLFALDRRIKAIEDEMGD
ncbi:MAG: CcmD family protein [Chitinophagales bacterium]